MDLNKPLSMQELETSEPNLVAENSLSEVKVAKPRKPRAKKEEIPVPPSYSEVKMVLKTLKDAKTDLAEDERKILYGDPTAEEPVGIINGMAASEVIFNEWHPSEVNIDSVILGVREEVESHGVMLPETLTDRMILALMAEEHLTKESTKKILKDVFDAYCKESLTNWKPTDPAELETQHQKEVMARLAMVTKLVQGVVRAPTDVQTKIIDALMSNESDKPEPELRARLRTGATLVDTDTASADRVQIKAPTNHDRVIWERAKRLGISVLDYIATHCKKG
jgi:hypothetical protein